MDNEQERFGFLRTIEKYATQFLKVRSRVIDITIFTLSPERPGREMRWSIALQHSLEVSRRHLRT